MKLEAKVEKIVGKAQGMGLAAIFRAKSEKMKNEYDKALLTGALMIERDAKKLCPVDTGRLRASITHHLEKAGNREAEASTGTNVDYAPYVEFPGIGEDTESANLYEHLAGSGRRYKTRQAKPFLFPAYRMNKDKIIALIADAWRKVWG